MDYLLTIFQHVSKSLVESSSKNKTIPKYYFWHILATSLDEYNSKRYS
jgi:hypothetical protein